jgi:hypothetical protein
MKIIEYKTATADNLSAFDKEVNKLLAQGYQLYGSPYAVENKLEGAIGPVMIAQAMIKHAMYEKLPPADPAPGMTLSH